MWYTTLFMPLCNPYFSVWAGPGDLRLMSRIQQKWCDVISRWGYRPWLPSSSLSWEARCHVAHTLWRVPQCKEMKEASSQQYLGPQSVNPWGIKPCPGPHERTGRQTLTQLSLQMKPKFQLKTWSKPVTEMPWFLTHDSWPTHAMR